MRTLIVDDNQEYRAMLEKAFSQYGLTDIVVNGTEAFKAFSRALKAVQPYHLVILDLNMPMRDGGETVASIRQLERKLKLFGDKACLVVAVSGFNVDSEIKRALDSGCNEFVSKAEGVRALLETIRATGILEQGKDEEFEERIREHLFPKSKDE